MRLTRILVPCFGALLVALTASMASANVRLPAIMGDNMVVQQDQPVRIWGWADPGEKVTVEMAGQKASATADKTGHWEVRVGPFAAGGPHTMTVSGRNTVSVSNVLVGEVWVASGQSNMEWPLRDARDGKTAASQATIPEIRLFTVAKATSVTPEDDVDGRWVVCTPETALSFSAVAFYFGRELHEKLGVPVGLIHTSWGGTPAEAWTSREALLADASLAPMVATLDSAAKDLPAAQKAYEAARAKWEAEHFVQDPGNTGVGLGYARPEYSDDDWKTMELPQPWESAGLEIDGAVWYRRSVDVPADWAGKELMLSLGPIDDFDTTYFNGEQVGATGPETQNSYIQPRKYSIPGRLVHAGRNVIAVRVFDHIGGGGFGGFAGDMTLAPVGAPTGSLLSIAGPWRYKVAFGVPGHVVDWSGQPSPPMGADNQNSPTVLYNAMIAPIVPLTIRGAIWYQGEANADRALQYRTLFPTMIRDWRKRWGLGDFPFYFVQLANYQARLEVPSESGWAELRDAQLSTLALPNTGMAVIVDIGDANDIHPRNKVDVGHRLALWALAETYGKKLEHSGPLATTGKADGRSILVRFSHAEGLRTPNGEPVTGFAVAGADGKYVWARARIEGDAVVVWSDDVAQPVAVRYAWADNPAANLYNGAGLPASPFQIDLRAGKGSGAK